MMKLQRAMCSIAIGTTIMGVSVPAFAATSPLPKDTAPAVDARLNGFARPGQADHGVAHGRPAYPGERGRHLGWYKDPAKLEEKLEKALRVDHDDAADTIDVLEDLRWEGVTAPAFWSDLVAWLGTDDGEKTVDALDDRAVVNPTSFLNALKEADLAGMDVAPPAFWGDFRAWMDADGINALHTAQAAMLTREAAKDLSFVAGADAEANARVVAWLNTSAAADALRSLVADGTIDDPEDVLARTGDLDLDDALGRDIDAVTAALEDAGDDLDAATVARRLDRLADRIESKVDDRSDDVTAFLGWLRSDDAVALVMSLAERDRLDDLASLTDEDFDVAGIEKPAFLAGALADLSASGCANATNRGALKNPDVPGHQCPPGNSGAKLSLFQRFLRSLGFSRGEVKHEERATLKEGNRVEKEGRDVKVDRSTDVDRKADTDAGIDRDDAKDVDDVDTDDVEDTDDVDTEDVRPSVSGRGAGASVPRI